MISRLFIASRTMFSTVSASHAMYSLRNLPTMPPIRHVLNNTFNRQPIKYFQTKSIPLGDLKDQKEFLELLKKDAQGTNEFHRDYVKFEHSQENIVGNKNTVSGEIDGPKGKEPTRYGDWERKGRVFDF